MKVDGHVSVSLDGPLSRNDRLRSLRPGDSVRASVIERIDRTSAKIAIHGNIIHARFNGPVPDEKELVLVVRSFSSSSLILEMKRQSPGSVPWIDAFLGGSLAAEMKKRGILGPRLKSSDAGLFSLLRLYTGSKDRTASFRAVAQRLVAAGYSADLPLLSGILSGLGDREISLCGLLFEHAKKQASKEKDDADKPGNSDAMLSEALSEAMRSVSRTYGFVAFYDDDGVHIVDCITTMDFFACSFDLPSLGSVECLVRGNASACSAVLVADEGSLPALLDTAGDLQTSLATVYPDFRLEIMGRAALREKILALAGSISDNAFDVTV